MNLSSAPVTALTFLGILIVVLGTFVAGSVTLMALGLASIFGAGLIGLAADRRS